MADEPTYPEDAPVGEGEHSADDRKRKKLVRAGVAFGIGSAAIVAALLYANRGKRGDKGNG
jgi:hypothetical protein